MSAQLASPIHLSMRPHPFDIRRELVQLPAGLTVAEIVERALPDRALRGYLVVRLQGELIPREAWHRLRPKAGVLLEAVPLPQGGNSELLRTVLMIAIVAGAMALGGWVAAPFFTGVGFTFASAAIGGALPLGGPMAMTILPPIPASNPATIEA